MKYTSNREDISVHSAPQAIRQVKWFASMFALTFCFYSIHVSTDCYHDVPMASNMKEFLRKECVRAPATYHTAGLTGPLEALAPAFAVYETCPTSAQRTSPVSSRHIISRVTDWLSEQCFTSTPTQYRLSGRGFYRSKDPTNSIKVLKE